MPKKDYTKLQKRVITDKKGHRRGVWVKRVSKSPFKYVVTKDKKQHGFKDKNKVKSWAKTMGMDKVEVTNVDEGKKEVINVT